MTLAEVRLWLDLRRDALGARFRRQHPIGPFIADFACLASRLVIEVDGLSHDRPHRARRDLERDRWLTERGWTVLRYNDEDILDNLDGVIDQIRDHL